MWSAFYLFAVAASGQWLHWSAVGCVGLTLPPPGTRTTRSYQASTSALTSPSAGRRQHRLYLLHYHTRRRLSRENMHPKAEVQTDQCTPGFDGIHAGGDLAGTLTFLDQRAEQVLDRAPDCSHEALDLVVVGRQFDRGSDE